MESESKAQPYKFALTVVLSPLGNLAKAKIRTCLLSIRLFLQVVGRNQFLQKFQNLCNLLLMVTRFSLRPKI